MNPLTVAQINQLRVLINKGRKPAPMTREECNAKRNAGRIEFKAAALRHAQITYDQSYARILRNLESITNGGPVLSPELAIGERPTMCTPRMQVKYSEHLRNTTTAGIPIYHTPKEPAPP